MSSINADLLTLFTGNANPVLAQAVAKELKLPMGKAFVGRFSDGEIQVEIQEISLETPDFLVIFPNQSIATAGIFQDPELTRDHAQITIDGFLASPLLYQSNDCQAVAVRICPEVKQALDWITQAVPGSQPRMSGSGSSVFAVLDPKTDTAELENLLQNLPEGWVGRVVRGLNKNPAYNLISSD